MDEAEQLYYGACTSALVKRAFCALAADLEQRAPEAGEYLRYQCCAARRGRASPKSVWA